MASLGTASLQRSEESAEEGAAKAYMEIVKACKALPEFTFARLKEELRFAREAWKVPGHALTLVDSKCKMGAEDADNFADGSACRATGTIKATTWWLAGCPPQRVVCKGTREYIYDLYGHSGGVAEATGSTPQLSVVPDSEDLKAEESALIETATAYLLRSCHDRSPWPVLPRVLRNFPYYADGASFDSDLGSEDSESSEGE